VNVLSVALDSLDRAATQTQGVAARIARISDPLASVDIRHARYYWLLLAESHLTRRLSGSTVRRIASLPLPTGEGAAAGRQTGRRKAGDGEVHEKSLEIRHFRAFPYSKEAELALSGAAGFARDGRDKRNGSDGGGWMYNRWWPGGQVGNPG
jgi:hypothetical protein